MKENSYKMGLVSVSFRRHTPKDILEAMKSVGLSLIEWGSDVHAPYDNIETLNEISKMQKEYGIVCSSYGTYFRLGESPLEELESYIQAAKILGTDILRLWCGTKNGKNMSAKERDDFLSVCRNAAVIAEKHKVILCMECHKKTFTENPDDAIWLMESIHSPHFRMYWQPFQWQTTDENIENAKKISPYTEHIHVFNWKQDQKLPLADAALEWQEYLKNFSFPRTLLLEFMPGGTMEELPVETTALKRILGEAI